MCICCLKWIHTACLRTFFVQRHERLIGIQNVQSFSGMSSGYMNVKRRGVFRTNKNHCMDVHPVETFHRHDRPICLEARFWLPCFLLECSDLFRRVQCTNAIRSVQLSSPSVDVCFEGRLAIGHTLNRQMCLNY